jgi:hypothetical protein
VRLAAAIAGAAVVGWAAAPAARGDPLEELAGYERQAVEQVLDRRGLRVDPRPEGKRIGRVVIVNLEVFTDEDGPLRRLNALRVTTRADTIERELLLSPGDLWDRRRAKETARLLRDPHVTSMVAVIPIESSRPGEVDLLVVTRDAWSLRLGSGFEMEDGRLTRLTLEPAERNLLGRRTLVGLRLELDPASLGFGPQVHVPRLPGSRLEAEAAAMMMIERDSRDPEGAEVGLRLGTPLRSLASRRGATAEARCSSTIERTFRGGDVATYDAPETAEKEAIPRAFRLRACDVGVAGVRRFGRQGLHDLELGWELTVRRPSIPDDVEASPAALAAFERDVLPRSERLSAVGARYRFFVPDYVSYYNLDTFDLSEDRLLGPELLLSGSAASRLLISEADVVRLSGDVGWRVDIDGRGYAGASLSASWRVGGDGVSDRTLAAGGFAYLPFVGPLRPVLRLQLAAVFDDGDNRLLTAGGETRLRGWEVGAFAGKAAAVANLELRSAPAALGVVRAGVVGFWDGGHAAESLMDLRLRHDVGLGLRILVPQLGPSVLRIDWAVPLGPGAGGLPGRISLGWGRPF